MDKVLREENVKTSARNINTVRTMTGDTEWLTLRTSDVDDVMEELRRLQKVEDALLMAVKWKTALVESARLAGDEAARECEIEEKILWRNEERSLRTEAYALSRIAEGKIA